MSAQKKAVSSPPLDFQTLLKKHSHRRMKAHKTYSVLAKDDVRWRTILARTEDIDLARAMMDEANVSGGYQRIILCQAELTAFTDQDDIRWQTIECAIPLKRNTPTTAPDDIRRILERLEGKEPRPKHCFGRRKAIQPAPRNRQTSSSGFWHMFFPFKGLMNRKGY